MADFRENDVVEVEVAVVAEVVGETRRVTVPRETRGTVVMVMHKPSTEDICLVEFVVDNKTTALATVPIRNISRPNRTTTEYPT